MSAGLFEVVTRNKLRFDANCGSVGVEDLWDLNLLELNRIAVNLNKAIKASKEEDFLKEVSTADATTMCKFETVLYILNLKKQEKANLVKKTENKAMKDKLVDALARKQDASLDGMTEVQIKRAINKL